MLKRFLVLFTLGLTLSLAYADTPVGPMNYQGRLLDNAGIPVTGNYNFVVRVYDAVSAGTLKYQENHNAVAVDDGVYALLVGTQAKSGGDSTWSVELWNCCSALYLEVVVNGETLAPRHRLSAAPYAFQANLALTTNNALALGGKSSGAVLQDICKANKGKWLELANAGAGACLGVGSSYPGPVTVNINTLTSSTDFTNLDLTNANISGINFGAVNFSGTLLKNTVIAGGIFTGANFANSTWDGVTTISPVTVNFDMTRAKMKNMSLASFSMTDASKLQFVSIGYITACPAALPGYYNWTCRVQKTTPSTVYFVAGGGGTGINYSRDSAMADDSLGVARLDVDSFAGATISDADFRGMLINQSFDGAYYYGADFSNADIWNVNFGNSGVGDFAKFDNARLHHVNFSKSDQSLLYMTSSSFKGATLEGCTLRNIVLEGVNLQGVTIYNSDFSKYDDNGAGVDFTGAIVHNSKFWSVNQMYADFTNARFYGSGPGSVSTFWKSDIRNMVFTGALFTDMVFDSNVTLVNTNFVNTKWVNPTFTNVNATGTNFQGARFYDLQPNALSGITNWSGARCPDNYLIPNPASGQTCLTHLLP